MATLRGLFLGLLLSTVFDTLNDSLHGTLSSVGAQDGTVRSPSPRCEGEVLEESVFVKAVWLKLQRLWKVWDAAGPQPS